MSEIIIKYNDTDGLQFFIIKNGELTLSHKIKSQNLQKMSMKDFEYAVATNLLIDLKSIRHVFSDYLWSDDGKTRPKLNPDQKRN